MNNRRSGSHAPRWIRRLTEGWRELRRTPVRFALRLALARLITQWRSLLTVIAGAILTACIGALVPLYTTAVAQVGMTQRLAEAPPRDAHVSAYISLRASTPWADGSTLVDKAAQSASAVQALVTRDLSVIEGWVDEVVTFAEAEATGIARRDASSGEFTPLTGVRVRLGYYSGWTSRVRLVDGRLPQDIPAGGEDIEIAIGLAVANELNLAADMVVLLDQGMDAEGNTGGGHPSSRPITARIVGVIAPLDEGDPFWMAPSPIRLLDRASGAGLWAYDFAALTTETALFRVATDFLPDTPTRIGWRILFAHDNLPYARIDRARAALRTFERDMRATFTLAAPSTPDQTTRQDLGFTYYTRLIDYDLIRKDQDKGILRDYAEEQALLGVPFAILLGQVGALVLFFVVVTAALVRRSERREIAMLQSRGAWDSQILLLRGIEALVICILAALIAPFLAQALLTALGPGVAGTQEFPLPLTPTAFGTAGLAALITFLALMLSLVPVLRMPLVLAGGAAARSERQHWWQRLYLDVIVALVALVALWALVQQGSPLSDTTLGDKQADPLMLAAPALLFVALGSLALRAFPTLAALAARFAAARRGVLQALAGWQLSREPVHYGRITFLLALAVGTGWFATSFRATLSNSHSDQARYLVGTDVRLIERDTALNVNRARPADAYMAQEGVVAASTAFRVRNTNLSANLAGDLRGSILAIDPDTFGQTLYWRGDLGPVYSPRAPGDAPSLPPRGEALPLVPTRIGLWVRFQVQSFRPGSEGIYRSDVGRLVQRTELWLRLLDAEGVWVRVPVRPVEVEYARVGQDTPGLGAAGFVTTGWVYCEADLSALEYAPAAPLNLVSFYWQYRSPSARGERGMRLTLADATLIGADGSVTSLPVFAGRAWEFLYDSGALATGDVSPGWQISGERSDAIYVTWQQEAQRSTVGVLLNYPDLGPVDAVVSRRVQSENGLTWGLDAAPFTLPGIGGSSVQFRAVQITDYYPSLFDRAPTLNDPKGDSFIVVDVRELLYRLNRRPSAAFYPDEVWLRLGEGIDAHSESQVSAFVRSLDEGAAVVLGEVTLAHELSKLNTDPLALGLLGLMYLAFIMALALSIVGLLTYAGLTAQARRTEFGVLRALGLSSLRVVLALALEQGFVMGVAVTLGALLGWVLASQVVPTLALGAAGEGVIPPFVMRVETQRLLEYALLLLVTLGLVLASSLVLVRQLSLARTLRLGDE
ncbi:MAG: FtsX-like permease family protein [Aggregatilineaceae bacterium]